MLAAIPQSQFRSMVKPLTTIEKNARIASYRVPASTWLLGAVVLLGAAGVRWLEGSTLHQVAGLALFALFMVNALNFLIPFLRPNSVLGGAQCKTLALASFAVLGFFAVH
jgi:hypothetical protein